MSILPGLFSLCVGLKGTVSEGGWVCGGYVCRALLERLRSKGAKSFLVAVSELSRYMNIPEALTMGQAMSQAMRREA